LTSSAKIVFFFFFVKIEPFFNDVIDGSNFTHNYVYAKLMLINDHNKAFWK